MNGGATALVPLLELRGITKRFGDPAVDLAVLPRDVHTLLDETLRESRDACVIGVRGTLAGV
jgi:hypothetical protein